MPQNKQSNRHSFYIMTMVVVLLACPIKLNILTRNRVTIILPRFYQKLYSFVILFIACLVIAYPITILMQGLSWNVKGGGGRGVYSYIHVLHEEVNIYLRSVHTVSDTSFNRVQRKIFPIQPTKY